MLKKHINVLLVEDDPGFAFALKSLLNRKPLFTFDLTHLTTVAAAEQLLKNKSFDVIILDLTLPDSHGLDTLTRIRRACSTEAIVVLTGQDQEDLATQALHAGAQDYLIKGEILGRVLSRAIEHSIERARLMYEREDFVATLTHDLKNPLLSSTEAIERMMEQEIGQLNDQQTDLLGHIRTSNNTLLNFIGNLLEVYRFEKDVSTMQFERTNLVQIISNCMKEFAPIAIDKRIQMVQLLPPDETDETVILGDGESLARVFRNLLDNAFKFTPSGGKVQVSLAAQINKVTLVVSDNGPGISKSDQEHLFERFWRGCANSRHTPGTGLGLYLCQQIVSLHKGTITCICKEGKGTAFLVELPINHDCLTPTVENLEPQVVSSNN